MYIPDALRKYLSKLSARCSTASISCRVARIRYDHITQPALAQPSAAVDKYVEGGRLSATPASRGIGYNAACKRNGYATFAHSIKQRTLLDPQSQSFVEAIGFGKLDGLLFTV